MSDHVTIQTPDPNLGKVMYFRAHHTPKEYGEYIWSFRGLNDGDMGPKWSTIYSNPQGKFVIKLATSPEISSMQQILSEQL